jgi:hypothetical protein
LAGCFEEVIIQHNVTLHFLMKIKLFHCHLPSNFNSGIA